MKKRKKGKEADVHPKQDGGDLVETLELRRLYDNRPVTSYKSFEFKGPIEHKTSILGIVYNGVAKIKSMLKHKQVSELTIDRQYLPEILNESIIEISREDGLPRVTSFASKYFKERGITIKYSGNAVTFKNAYKGT